MRVPVFPSTFYFVAAGRHSTELHTAAGPRNAVYGEGVVYFLEDEVEKSCAG